ncbi:hypothetical protein [Floccifex sp.]|uniref:hypothetical protein n=1 Tax=Floccifex sp. TaxID=2815810 RepID=UPI003F075D0B
MMVSNHEKQIKEEYVYNEEFTETFLDSDQSTGFRLVVVDCVAGSKIYELEKTLDGGKNWILINKDPFHGKSGLVKEINFEYEDYGCIVITNVSGTRLTKFVTYDGGITFSETESYFTDNGY